MNQPRTMASATRPRGETLPGMTWPSVSSVDTPGKIRFLKQLRRTQWWPSPLIRSYQLKQLGLLVHYAAENVPYYRNLFSKMKLPGVHAYTPEKWREIPILTRTQLQKSHQELKSPQPPVEHGPVSHTVTSGSTGRPVVTYRTGINRMIWQAVTVREHLWHDRHFSGKLMSIRHGICNEDHPEHTTYAYDWGPSTRELFRTGPGIAMDVSTGIQEQIRMLCEQQPDYLLAYPSNLEALAEYIELHGTKVPPLKEMRTYGEILPPDLREFVKRVWNVNVVDNYSSQEVGYMALQCPEYEHYHVQSETILIEVLDEAGGPCEPGGVGRVVVTALHNFAMPLIRYEIDDYAEVGRPCNCGRSLPVLQRIYGRQRNMFTLPNGDKVWPSFREGPELEAIFDQLPPIEQFQLIQHSLEEVEMRLITSRRLTPVEESKLSNYLARSISRSFRFHFSYPEQIPRSPTGKFEECISLVGAA